VEDAIAEPKHRVFHAGAGDDKPRGGLCQPHRLGSGVGKQAMRRRAEIVERFLRPQSRRGGMAPDWLRGRENVHKRYLVHVAGHTSAS